MDYERRLHGDPMCGVLLRCLRPRRHETSMTEEQIKHMVSRFLGWKLPQNFSPDGGISFKKTFNDHLPTPMKNESTGTNVFDADQALGMVRYMIEGLPKEKTMAPRKIYTPEELVERHRIQNAAAMKAKRQKLKAAKAPEASDNLHFLPPTAGPEDWEL